MKILHIVNENNCLYNKIKRSVCKKLAEPPLFRSHCIIEHSEESHIKDGNEDNEDNVVLDYDPQVFFDELLVILV
jgi:hypothetical protein